MDDKREDGDHESYPNRGRNPINDLYRLRDVQRWQIVNVGAKENVAEHSYFVTLLAMRIALAIGAPVGPTVRYALLHDAEEAWIGDIPSPVKQYVDQSMVPIQEMMGDMLHPVDGLVQGVVKLADIATDIKFLIVHGKDTRHVSNVQNGLSDRLWEYAGNLIDVYPAFRWDDGLSEIKNWLDNKDETFIDDYITKEVRKL